jgi:hypothetical protein
MNEKITIGGIERYVGDKLEFMLSDTIIHWETLLKAYDKYKNDEIFFEEVLKILGIKENKNLRELILPISKKIYNLPDKFHIIGMMKQYFIYEPLSLVIHNIFMLIKNHYEKIVTDFITARNTYIIKNKLNEPNIKETKIYNSKNQLNDLNYLIDLWSNLDLQNNLNTSSIILYFINPPENIDNQLNLDMSYSNSNSSNSNSNSSNSNSSNSSNSNSSNSNSNLKKQIKKLLLSIKKFNYPGFCPKVPYSRLKKLLTFPLTNFIKTIQLLDPDYKSIDYKNIESKIKKILNQFKSINPLQNYENSNKRLKNPIKAIYKKINKEDNKVKLIKKNHENYENSQMMIEIIKWYVDKTIELRNKLLPDAKKIEKYYNELAKSFEKIYDILKPNL